MATAAQFAAEVRRAVEDQPYTVVDETDDGFTVHIDVVDARWWSLFHRNGLKQTWRWVVKVKGSSYTVTDKPVAVRWQAGVDGAGGGTPRPTLKFLASTSQGTTISLQKTKIWAIRDDGTFGNVVDFTFDSREGRDLIDAVAERHGLSKRMNASAKIGLYAAVLAGGGTALGGLWALYLWLTGNLPA